uniref:Uncharacterized protein n=1 Tax=Avena sativa TaxID=4498 RepID=A0ACD5XHS3_AVESA
MASALRFAARKICGGAFQRPPQPYFRAAAEAAVKEEQARRLFTSIGHGHGGSSVRQFGSYRSPNRKHAGVLDVLLNSNPPPWSPRSKHFFTFVWGYSMALCAVCYITIPITSRLFGPFKDPFKEQSCNCGREPYASEKAE